MKRHFVNSNSGGNGNVPHEDIGEANLEIMNTEGMQAEL